MAQLISVKLSRFDGSPWGFRLQGGKDFGTPLIVQKVNGGSPAEAAGLKAGDAVIRVNNTDMFNLRHKDAQDVIVRSGNNFEMTVQRGGSTWRPSVSPVSQSIPSPQPHLSAGSISPVTKTSLAAKKTDGHLIGSGHNFSPKPYPNGTSDSGAIKSIVNKQYNSPVGIYSEQTIAETLSAQAEVLAGGVLGVNFKKNEKNYTPENSEVFKMVREADKEPKTPEPTDSAIHSGVVTPSSPALTGLRSVSAPETKPQPTPPPQGSLSPGQNICAECERLIVGVFVRIKEKNLHVECFKCSTCGTSLKNVGYYNINSKLYCDIHAKLVARQQAPAGYIPVTVSPGAKAPASTISAALGNFQTHSAMSPTPFSNGNSSTPFSTRRTFYRPPSSSSSYTGDYYGVSSQPVDRTGTGTYESLSSDVNNRMIMKNDDVMNHQHNNNSNSNNYKTYTSTITIRTGSEVGNKDYYSDDINNTPSHLGSSPRADKSPSSSLVQGNISGPKPFGGSSNFGPSSNFNSTPTSNPITNNFSRPQSQTVTESYHAEYNYLEEKDIRGTPAPSTADEYSRPPSSVRNKSLQWPPIKSVEDITYPTASPIWIDPNPILDRRPRHNVQDKQSELKESSCRRSESVNRKRDDYRREESNYGYWGEEPMENKPVCSAPFYRKTTTTECSEVRQQSRSSSLTRPGSAEGVRRSLTPTRISQPVPRPWTGSSETGSYGHVQAPVPPPPESTICRKVCTCEIVCERISGPGGPEHEQEHVYREVKCEVCNPPPCMQVSDYDEEQQIEQPCDILDQQTDSEVVDLSKVVPPDVAVCPKGVENQHNMYTETMEKDEGNIHIKKTTIYEKTVEVVSPTSSPANDNEVENYSGRKKNVDSAEKISSFIETKRMIEEARQEELRQRETYEEECRREEEKIRRAQEEEERREANRLKLLQAEKEEKERRKQEQRRETEMRIRQEEEERSGKHVSFSQNQSRNYQNESRVMSAEEHYRELKSEIKIQNTDQFEEERRESLRQQVQVHKSLREQQAPERRQQQQQQASLQERRLEKRFRPQSPPHETSSSSSSCQRKHVQFVKQTESGTCPMQATPVPNSTPKEWKSEMVNALTTAPSRPYTPLQPSNLQSASQYHEDNNACSTKTMYSSEVRYEETSRSFPPPPQPQPYVPRPGSPFTDALTIAPERPYTPLGEDHSDRGYESVICVDRGETPINQSTPQGYCHPAEILYTDSTTRQSRSRERNLSKVQGPRPLPTPPANYKFRDASPSPARTLSRSETPRDPSLPASLKRPDTIPSYQKHLITEDYDPVEAHPYVPSRSPTPCRPKSPAQGPGYLPNPLQHNLGRKPYVSKVPDYDQPSSESYSYQSQSGSYSSYPEQQSKQVTYRAQENSTPQSQCTESYGMRSYASEDHSEKQCSRTSYAEKYKRIEEKQLEACRQSEMMLSKSEESLVDESTCGISKVSRNPPTLPCPVVAPQSSVSERIQRTGVRVLPTPCETTTSSSQICESRPICHQQKETKCPNTGVTILPCRAISDAGSRAGIVIVPCEGSEAQCPQSGVRITPTPDRGLCVSPVAHGRSSGSCYGDDNPRAGGCQIDVGNCPGSGVKVGTCADGTVCVAPWKLSQCPKPILKCPAKPVPFPHIPLPDQEESGCDSCPLKNQQQRQQPAPQQDYNPPNTSYPSNNNSFKPINGQSRTNLSNQLTRLTVRRDKQLVQLFKPQPQSSQPCTDGVHCEPNVNRSCTDGVHCEPDPYRSPAPAQQNRTPNPSSFEPTRKTQNSVDPPNFSSYPDLGSGVGGPSNGGSCKFAGSSAPKRGRGILNQAGAGGRQPLCGHCNSNIRGPFITALGQIWCPEHFVCVNPQCRRPLHEIGFVEEKGQLYCEYCFERFIAPSCNKCNGKIKGDCLNAIGKAYHPDCFSCAYCGKIFGNSPFFLEEGLPYCEADWNELFTTKCFACGFPVEAGDRWVEALNNNYHSQCFNCTMCKKNLEGQSFYAKAGRPFCKNHAR
ncbi:PDZ and LIM domain protein Zasp [Microplitis demolitor]|uniref:PDZ and LIM domain protein Zasp n=1 Tax=Microplitis demolitor TaxID=69319 RepID=UPI00235B6CB5|nr:PDZ and LIM domain protein Zasp [Microplitis demolitor]